MVLNSFENLIKAVVHLHSTHTQKITEAMIVGTNWPFSIFTIGQESGPRIIVGFFFLFLTMVAEFRKEKKGEQKKNPGHCFRKYWKQNGL